MFLYEFQGQKQGRFICRYLHGLNSYFSAAFDIVCMISQSVWGARLGACRSGVQILVGARDLYLLQNIETFSGA